MWKNTTKGWSIQFRKQIIRKLLFNQSLLQCNAFATEHDWHMGPTYEYKPVPTQSSKKIHGLG